MERKKLKTVKVPEGLVDVFGQAEQVVSHYFSRRRDDPERGTIEIFGDRYVLLRAASLSVEFFALVRDLYGTGREAEADAFAGNLLFDLAHAVGRSDAKRFHSLMELDDPIERLTAGPVHFSHAGWAFVDILPESKPAPDESYYLIYDHPYSFEAHAWLSAGRQANHPVCIMNAGYSSGWCQASFGVQLVSAEILCRARGDDHCRFIMAHPDRIEGFVADYATTVPQLAARMEGHQIPDFFARKRMEEELRRARDDLERRVVERTAELEEANRALKQEMKAREQAEALLRRTAQLEAVGRLAGSVAHDFNNLMAVVIGHTSLVEGRVGEDDPLRAHLARIRQAGEEAAQLTLQLLTFSSTEQPNPELVDLNHTIDDTTKMLERLIGVNVRLELGFSPDAGTVRINPGQLRQVVMNLVVNARDAMPMGGALRIETAPLDVGAEQAHAGHGVAAGAWTLLRVSDTGVGMDEETRSKAFDPFFTTKQPGVGTGLGLSTVHRIVTQAEGSVLIESRPGVGTTFSLYLPRIAQPPDPVPGKPPPPPAVGGPETILVVEDQDEVRLVVVTILEDLGYRVLEATGPEEALRLAADSGAHVDLLLTDIVMPHMNGREVADRLRSARPDMKCLLMSGYANPSSLGEDDESLELISKPFTARALGERVRLLLDG